MVINPTHLEPLRESLRLYESGQAEKAYSKIAEYIPIAWDEREKEYAKELLDEIGMIIYRSKLDDTFYNMETWNLREAENSIETAEKFRTHDKERAMQIQYTRLKTRVYAEKNYMTIVLDTRKCYDMDLADITELIDYGLKRIKDKEEAIITGEITEQEILFHLETLDIMCNIAEKKQETDEKFPAIREQLYKYAFGKKSEQIREYEKRILLSPSRTKNTAQIMRILYDDIERISEKTDIEIPEDIKKYGQFPEI